MRPASVWLVYGTRMAAAPLRFDQTRMRNFAAPTVGHLEIDLVASTSRTLPRSNSILIYLAAFACLLVTVSAASVSRANDFCTATADRLMTDGKIPETFDRVVDALNEEVVEFAINGRSNDVYRDQTTHSRFATSLRNRFIDGCYIAFSNPKKNLAFEFMVSRDGDVVARYFVPVVRWPSADRSHQLRRILADALSGTSRFLNAADLAEKETFVELLIHVWESHTFARLEAADQGTVYAWGVLPDFIEINVSTMSEKDCPFLPEKNWIVRMACP